MQRPLLAVALVVLAATAGCPGAGRVEGSGTKASSTRPVTAFDRVDVKLSADVTIKVGGAASVVVDADDNLLPIITTDVDKRVLVISSAKPFSTKLGITIAVATPELVGVLAAGSGKIDATGVDAKSFRIELAGSADATIQGRADKVLATLSGSGNEHLFGLVAKDVDVHLTGSGTIEVFATEELDATIAGSGNVDYKGSPRRVNPKVLGSGAVRPR